jgi:hypothetical protein
MYPVIGWRIKYRVKETKLFIFSVCIKKFQIAVNDSSKRIISGVMPTKQSGAQKRKR